MLVFSTWGRFIETIISLAHVGYIPLTNRSARAIKRAKRASHKSRRKKRGSVTYSTDREDEVSKIFIISLLCA